MGTDTACVGVKCVAPHLGPRYSTTAAAATHATALGALCVSVQWQCTPNANCDDAKATGLPGVMACQPSTIGACVCVTNKAHLANLKVKSVPSDRTPQCPSQCGLCLWGAVMNRLICEIAVSPLPAVVTLPPDRLLLCACMQPVAILYASVWPICSQQKPPRESRDTGPQCNIRRERERRTRRQRRTRHACLLCLLWRLLLYRLGLIFTVPGSVIAC